jgi:hypothetical protein
MKVSGRYFDELFDFKGQWDLPSRCGLKIIERAGSRPVVIVTELYQENPGTSVTAAGRSLAVQVCEARGLDVAGITYLECNPGMNSKLSFYDEELFEVTFRDAPPHAYRRWTKEEARALFDEP